MKQEITVYFDELSTNLYPDGAFAACFGNPADGVDTAYANTKELAIFKCKKGIFGE